MVNLTLADVNVWSWRQPVIDWITPRANEVVLLQLTPNQVTELLNSPWDNPRWVHRTSTTFRKQFSHFRTIRPLCSFAISAQWRREWNELPWFFCYVWVCLNRREQKKTLLSHFSVIAKHSIFYHCSPANILCVHYGAALPFLFICTPPRTESIKQ